MLVGISMLALGAFLLAFGVVPLFRLWNIVVTTFISRIWNQRHGERQHANNSR